MPEARRLVTGGPYALARHPLYTVEMVTICGTALQFAGALVLGAGGGGAGAALDPQPL